MRDAAQSASPQSPAAGDGASVFAGFEWWIAGRYLRAKRRESFVSIISVISFVGIALGVATLITVMAVMNGFRDDLMTRLLGVSGHIVVQSAYGPLPDYDALAEDVRTVPGVTRVTPLVEGGVMAVSGSRFSYGLVRGIRPDDLRQLDLVADKIVAGSLDDFRGSKSIVLGSGLAAQFGVLVGDTVTLITPRGAATPFGTVPRQKAYRVAAVFRAGLQQIDDGLIFMPMDQAQIYFQTGDAVNKLEVMIKDPNGVRAVRQETEAVLGQSLRIFDWQQINGTLVGALQVERNMMFIILALIIIVAALNIVSGLVMLVKDKGRDIAILRTMGATRAAILRIFLISGASIGVAGTAAGFALGLLLCFNIEAIRQGISALTGTELFPQDVYFLSEMTAQINNGEVIAVLLFALATSLLAPLYPAWRAARLDPVDALRYE